MLYLPQSVFLQAASQYQTLLLQTAPGSCGVIFELVTVAQGEDHEQVSEVVEVGDVTGHNKGNRDDRCQRWPGMVNPLAARLAWKNSNNMDRSPLVCMVQLGRAR